MNVRWRKLAILALVIGMILAVWIPLILLRG